MMTLTFDPISTTGTDPMSSVPKPKPFDVNAVFHDVRFPGPRMSQAQVDKDVEIWSRKSTAELQGLLPTTSPREKLVLESMIGLSSYIDKARVAYSGMPTGDLETLLKNPGQMTTTGKTIAGATLISKYEADYRGMDYNARQAVIGKGGLTDAQRVAMNRVQPPAVFDAIVVTESRPEPKPWETSGSGRSGSSSVGGSGGVNMGAVFGGFSRYDGVASGSNAAPVSSGLMLGAQISTGVILGGALAIGGGGAFAGPAMASLLGPLGGAPGVAGVAGGLVGIPALAAIAGGGGGGGGAALLSTLQNL